MSLAAAAKGVFRLAMQNLESTTQSVVPAIKGIGNYPEHPRIGLIKLVAVGGSSLICGGILAHVGAKGLEWLEWFVPSDDDDDD